MHADWPKPEDPTVLQLQQLAATYTTLGVTTDAAYLRLLAALVENHAVDVTQARRHLERYREQLRQTHPELWIAPRPSDPRP